MELSDKGALLCRAAHHLNCLLDNGRQQSRCPGCAHLYWPYIPSGTHTQRHTHPLTGPIGTHGHQLDRQRAASPRSSSIYLSGIKNKSSKFFFLNHLRLALIVFSCCAGSKTIFVDPNKLQTMMFLMMSDKKLR